uniref:V-SNARE coiled-coil homology domain-containing protein n=1 Tax=Helicotheca tamesis TaxID=374047 RepID=A0A7S2I7R4_9STRA|mmetsp:Transcript_6459/g.8737  ORF Transcript_6459/g.8737 Transcript_6459/m.8737 type:complete len:282 (+) Transcript_6459:74-919(+)
MIIYTVICRDTDGTVLAESTSGIAEGNFPQITREFINCLINNPETLPDGARKTYTHRGDFGVGDDDDDFMDGVNNRMNDVFKSVGMGSCLGPSNFDDETEELDLFYHALHGKNLICICLSDDDLAKHQNVNFSFLEDARDDFAKKYSSKKIKKANAYSMEKSFSPDLRKLTYYYNSNQKTMSQSEKVKRLTAQVDKLKDVMGNNIQLTLSRGGDLDELAEKGEMLVQETVVFKKNTKVMKNKSKNKNRFTYLFLGVAAAFLAYIISAGICGLTFQKCIRSF